MCGYFSMLATKLYILHNLTTSSCKCRKGLNYSFLGKWFVLSFLHTSTLFASKKRGIMQYKPKPWLQEYLVVKVTSRINCVPRIVLNYCNLNLKETRPAWMKWIRNTYPLWIWKCVHLLVLLSIPWYLRCFRRKYPNTEVWLDTKEDFESSRAQVYKTHYLGSWIME